MYAAFRENGESLPGDEEMLKKPSVKIYLYPHPKDQGESALPKLVSCQLIVQKNMTMEALKKYLAKKIDVITDINILKVFFKSIEMKNEWSFRDIERMFKFSDDKIIFYYSNKN
jgi:hypothetical protein